MLDSHWRLFLFLFFSRLCAGDSHGWRHHVFGMSVWLSVHLSVQFLWMRCLSNALSKCLQNWHKYSQGPTKHILGHDLRFRTQFVWQFHTITKKCSSDQRSASLCHWNFQQNTSAVAQQQKARSRPYFLQPHWLAEVVILVYRPTVSKSWIKLFVALEGAAQSLINTARLRSSLAAPHEQLVANNGHPCCPVTLWTMLAANFNKEMHTMWKIIDCILLHAFLTTSVHFSMTLTKIKESDSQWVLYCTLLLWNEKCSGRNGSRSGLLLVRLRTVINESLWVRL